MRAPRVKRSEVILKIILSLPLANDEWTERKDEYHTMLVAFVTSSDSSFIIEDCIKKVTATTGSINRGQRGISAYRRVKFKVHSRGEYDEVNRVIKRLLLPTQPPPQASTETKDAWRTICARLKLKYMCEAGMVHTVLYHKWISDRP